MSNTFHEYLEKQLQDPEVRAEYEAQVPEHEKAKAILRLMRELDKGRRSGGRKKAGYLRKLSERTSKSIQMNRKG